MYEELCDMLGIPSNEFRPRRSQSVVERARSSANEDEKRASYKGTESRSSTSGSRPLSMPDRSGLTEVYQNMSADVCLFFVLSKISLTLTNLVRVTRC